MKRGLRELVIICLLALVPALLTAWLSPVRKLVAARHFVSQISVRQAEALAAGHTVVWIDARAETAFLSGHIAGALRLTSAEWEALLPRVIEVWSPDATLIVYCDSRSCAASEQVAARLGRELQSERVYVLEGGWEAWLQTRQKQ